MELLIKQIEQWAEDRNIIKGSKPIDQAMKLFSEFGELADNIGKGRDCRDDIGDVFVVLTIMARQVNQPLHVNTKSFFVASLQDGFESSKEIVSYLALHLYFFTESCLKEKTKSVACILGALINLAHNNGCSLEECVQIAYNDIKDRKGVMYNGVFIKESDPAYQDALDNIEADKRLSAQKRISVNLEDL